MYANLTLEEGKALDLAGYVDCMAIYKADWRSLAPYEKPGRAYQGLKLDRESIDRLLKAAERLHGVDITRHELWKGIPNLGYQVLKNYQTDRRLPVEKRSEESSIQLEMDLLDPDYPRHPPAA